MQDLRRQYMGKGGSRNCTSNLCPESSRPFSRSINGNLRCDLGPACIRTSWIEVWDLKPASQAVNPDSTVHYPLRLHFFSFLFLIKFFEEGISKSNCVVFPPNGTPCLQFPNCMTLVNYLPHLSIFSSVNRG